ncbi:unnamed protein product [Sphagnum tenellum]
MMLAMTSAMTLAGRTTNRPTKVGRTSNEPRSQRWRCCSYCTTLLLRSVFAAAAAVGARHCCSCSAALLVHGVAIVAVRRYCCTALL